MEKGHLICLSFVAVLKRPLMVIPNMDGKFCRELFGMPYETFNGITPDGYVIAINNKPFPLIVISPTKIIFKAENKDVLLKYVEAVKGELQKWIYLLVYLLLVLIVNINGWGWMLMQIHGYGITLLIIK